MDPHSYEKQHAFPHRSVSLTYRNLLPSLVTGTHRPDRKLGNPKGD